MLVYPGHLQDWLDYGHDLVIFLILALFWLSEKGQICGFQAFLGERMGGGLKFCTLMYPEHFQIWLDVMLMVYWFF